MTPISSRDNSECVWIFFAFAWLESVECVRRCIHAHRVRYKSMFRAAYCVLSVFVYVGVCVLSVEWHVFNLCTSLQCYVYQST